MLNIGSLVKKEFGSMLFLFERVGPFASAKPFQYLANAIYIFGTGYCPGG